MKVLAINGSARKGGNTADMINKVLAQLEAEGIETQMIELGGKKIHGCLACGKCAELQNKRCVMDNDCLNECMEAMLEADGIILGSPTYFATISTEMSALIDRAGMVGLVNDSLFARKVGASVVTARRGGAMQTFNTLNSFFFISQMIVPGSRYWNMGFGEAKGEALNDDEGIRTMKILGQNMAWLMKKLHA